MGGAAEVQMRVGIGLVSTAPTPMERRQASALFATILERNAHRSLILQKATTAHTTSSTYGISKPGVAAELLAG